VGRHADVAQLGRMQEGAGGGKDGTGNESVGAADHGVINKGYSVVNGHCGTLFNPIYQTDRTTGRVYGKPN
jgi:hypothetical protein